MSTKEDKANDALNVEETSNESLILRPRYGFPLIPMSIGYLRSRVAPKHNTAIAISRRGFLASAAAASAGALMIRPLGAVAAPGFFGNLLGFFKDFAKGVLLNALNYGPGLTGIFGPVIANAQRILTGNYTPQGGAYGDENTQDPLGRYLLGMGDLNRVNAAGAVVDESRNILRGIFQGPSLLGLGQMLLTSGVQALMTTKKAQKGVKFVQKYLLPFVNGNNSLIAQEAGKTMFSPNRPFTRSYDLPQFYDSDSRALTLIDYVADSRQTPRGNSIRGRGESIIYMVSPEKAADVRRFVAQNPNFWTNEDARKQLTNGLNGLAENPLKRYPFEFESAD